MNPRVSALIDQFRTHFRSDMPDRVPAALRQESSSVIFVSLLEEDKPAAPPPVMGLNPMDQMGSLLGNGMGGGIGGDMLGGDMLGGDMLGMLGGSNLPQLPGSGQLMGSAQPLGQSPDEMLTLDGLLGGAGAPAGAPPGGQEAPAMSPVAPGARATPVNPLEPF